MIKEEPVNTTKEDIEKQIKFIEDYLGCNLLSCQKELVKKQILCDNNIILYPKGNINKLIFEAMKQILNKKENPI